MELGSNKKLETIYVIGASVIVVLVLMAYMAVSHTLDGMMHDSKVINVSGRQRMLSQKLVKDALVLANTDNATYASKLEKALAEFSKAHQKLKNGDVTDVNVTNSTDITEKFADLDPYFNRLYAAGKSILALSSLDSSDMSVHITTLLETEPEFLVRMDGITNLYDQESAKKPENLRLIALIAAILIVFAQLFIGFKVIMPAIKKARLLREKVQQNNKELQKAQEEQEQLNEELSQTNEELHTSTDRLKEYNQLITSSKDRLEEVLHSELEARHKAQELYEELSASQSKLIISERISSLGDLTSGIAHEINNPLNFVYAGIMSVKNLVDDLTLVVTKQEEYIMASTEEQRSALKTEINELKQDIYYTDLLTDLPELMKDVEEGAVRIVEIMTTLHEFTALRHSEGDSEVGRVDINHSIETSIMLSRRKLSSTSIDVKFNKDDSIAIVDGNKGKINEIVIHLFNNAIEAIGDKGNIIITTSNLPKEGKYQITIEDDGAGIPSKITSQIFAPFFTTKNIAKHRGMGLTIVQNIATEAGGHVFVESKEEQGTKICVEMPKYVKAAEAQEASVLSS